MHTHDNCAVLLSRTKVDILLLATTAFLVGVRGLTAGFSGSRPVITVREGHTRNVQFCVTVFDGELNEDLTLGIIYDARNSRR